MTPELAVHAIREALLAAFWLSAPLLLIGFVVGIAINLLQIATSMQDSAFSAVPRLTAFLFGFLLLLPWMMKKASMYCITVLGGLSRYAN